MQHSKILSCDHCYSSRVAEGRYFSCMVVRKQTNTPNHNTKTIFFCLAVLSLAQREDEMRLWRAYILTQALFPYARKFHTTLSHTKQSWHTILRGKGEPPLSLPLFVVPTKEGEDRCKVQRLLLKYFQLQKLRIYDVKLVFSQTWGHGASKQDALTTGFPSEVNHCSRSHCSSSSSSSFTDNNQQLMDGACSIHPPSAPFFSFPASFPPSFLPAVAAALAGAPLSRQK